VSLAPFLYNKFEMAASITVGNRGGKVLLYNGFKYQKNRLRTHAIYWRCWRKECRANLQTNVFDLDDRNPNIQILQESSHAHEEDDLVIEHDRVRNTLRNNIRQDRTPVSRLNAFMTMLRGIMLKEVGIVKQFKNFTESGCQ